MDARVSLHVSRCQMGLALSIGKRDKKLRSSPFFAIKKITCVFSHNSKYKYWIILLQLPISGVINFL